MGVYTVAPRDIVRHRAWVEGIEGRVIRSRLHAGQVTCDIEVGLRRVVHNALATDADEAEWCANSGARLPDGYVMLTDVDVVDLELVRSAADDRDKAMGGGS